MKVSDQTSVGCRVLIIDDNRDSGFTLAMLFKLKGFDAYVEHDGQAGIAAAKALRPQAIILDLAMPGLDGYETCRLIRAQLWSSGMTIIALSGYGQPEDIQRSYESGFDMHLVKPVDLDALVQYLTLRVAQKTVQN